MARLCCLALILAAAIFAALSLSPPRDDVPPPHTFGWIDDPAAVEEVRRALAVDFASTAAFRACQASAAEEVFLWDACRAVLGSLPPPRDQGSVGACVGFGTASAVEHLICVQIVCGAAERYCEPAPEIIYAGSRVEIGGGRVHGDGSTGAWAARFVHDYGVLPRGRYRGLDLQSYSPTACRRLGRTGVPDHLEPLLRQHPVRTVANIRTLAEARAALVNGYPLIVCSSQGFTWERDQDGFCQPSGTWMHCLAAIGLRGEPRPGFFLLNSWGEHAHVGPLGPGEPSPAGFWADDHVVEAMLRQGDSWALSNFQGFPAQPAAAAIAQARRRARPSAD